MQVYFDAPERPDWREAVMKQGLVFVDTEIADPDHPFQPDLTKVMSYWKEGTYVALDESETDRIGVAGAKMFQALIELTEDFLAFEREWHGDPNHRPKDCYFRKLAVPEEAIGPIMRSWQLDKPDESPNTDPEHWPSLYGRYDLRFELGPDGTIAGIKFLEFNADTPTSAVESTVIQDEWLKALRDMLSTRHEGPVDQWNGLYDAFVERWTFELGEYQRKTGKPIGVVHVACSEDDPEGEDMMTIAVIGSALEDAAKEMGTHDEPAFRVKYISVESITRPEVSSGAFVPDDTTSVVVGGLQNGAVVGYFTDGDEAYGPNGERIRMIFKLHPWEYFLDPKHTKHGFGQTAMHDLMSAEPTIWIEPPYCGWLWSNKGIWALMWERFKNDPEIGPYLLETYFKNDPNIPPGFLDNCAIKPLYSREGASLTLRKNGVVLEHGDGAYGDEGYIVQALAELPSFVDPDEGVFYVVAGLWMVGDEDVAICFRFSRGRITRNTSQFAPHVVLMGV